MAGIYLPSESEESVGCPNGDLDEVCLELREAEPFRHQYRELDEPGAL